MIKIRVFRASPVVAHTTLLYYNTSVGTGHATMLMSGP